MGLLRSDATFFANGKLHFDTITFVPNSGDRRSFVDGKLHWGTYISGPDEHLGENVISFDLAYEKWEKMEKPSYGEGETELCVGKLGSDLCVFTNSKTTDHLGAWVMKEYGVKESWIKMFTITYPDNLDEEPTFFVSNKGEISTVFGATSMIYNSKDESLRYSDVTNYHDE
ncbi:F-box protein CPR1-like [Solanum dulcamara]|uniref:F-box protein CPR1-like n=1 Tax=Solanum dulcamara TaxID=45834 RepID=UPI002485ECA2|nr:F-box protein CPR1-like [Solanum dulcamara]